MLGEVEITDYEIEKDFDDDDLGTNSNAPIAEPESLESSYILQCSPGR